MTYCFNTDCHGEGLPGCHQQSHQGLPEVQRHAALHGLQLVGLTECESGPLCLDRRREWARKFTGTVKIKSAALKRDRLCVPAGKYSIYHDAYIQ
jgi:hypothetical protein